MKLEPKPAIQATLYLPHVAKYVAKHEVTPV